VEELDMMGHINNLLIRIVEKRHGSKGVLRLFELAGNARSLFEKVPTIHKQWPAAVSAKDFREKLYVLESIKERLVFKYDSPNHLCGVLRFVAEGVLAYYRERGTVTKTKCALKGAPWCEIEVCFETP
jgi:hypothetical protein